MIASLNKKDGGSYGLSGELTFDTVNALYQRSDELFAASGNIEVDLNGVSRVDSAGLVLLVEWARRATRNNERLRFSGMSDQLKTMIRINGLQKIISTGS